MIGWSWTVGDLPHETRRDEERWRFQLLLAESWPVLGMLLHTYDVD